MFDVVKAAKDYRSELLTEMAKLEEFLRLAQRFVAMEEPKARSAPAPATPVERYAKPEPSELKRPSAEPVAEKQNGREPATRDEGQAASLRQAFFGQPNAPKTAVS